MFLKYPRRQHECVRVHVRVRECVCVRVCVSSFFDTSTVNEIHFVCGEMLLVFPSVVAYDMSKYYSVIKMVVGVGECKCIFYSKAQQNEFPWDSTPR